MRKTDPPARFEQFKESALLLFIVALIYWLLNRGKSNLYFDTSSGRQRGLMGYKTDYLENVRRQISSATTSVE